MGVTTFYRCALLLPLAMPLLAFPLGVNTVTGLLLLSLAFGGVQYAVYAVAMFVAIGRAKSDARVSQLIYVAPILFVPVQAIGWVISGYVQRLSNPELTGIADSIIPLACYTLVIGYGYVTLTALLCRLAERLGLVRTSRAP